MVRDEQSRDVGLATPVGGPPAVCEGMDLETLVRAHGPLPPGRVIHLLRQVCESLEEAHQRGLVHRDIKPANIHVGRVGVRGDFVKVLDFGLVKTAAGKDAGSSTGTGKGMAVGTPAYMAPEMMFGESVDGRADIYALGCVAYYMLTKRLVFEAENTVQMIAKHLQAEPVPPSQRTDQWVPAALDEIVLGCLAKDPKNRPRSAAVVARALSEVEVEPWSEEQARTWWEEERGTRGAGGGAREDSVPVSPRPASGVPAP